MESPTWAAQHQLLSLVGLAGMGAPAAPHNLLSKACLVKCSNRQLGSDSLGRWRWPQQELWCTLQGGQTVHT